MGVLRILLELITSKLQEKGNYTFYTYDQLYKENYQYTKDTYWINTLQALDRLHPSNFYNIVNFEYEYGTVEPKKKKTIKLEQYKEFLGLFFPQETIRNEQTQNEQTTTIITDESNVVKNLSFLNRMEELIKLLNDDYAYYFTNQFNEYINEEFSKNSDSNIEGMEEKYQEFLGKITKKIINLHQ